MPEIPTRAENAGKQCETACPDKGSVLEYDPTKAYKNCECVKVFEGGNPVYYQLKPNVTAPVTGLDPSTNHEPTDKWEVITYSNEPETVGAWISWLMVGIAVICGIYFIYRVIYYYLNYKNTELPEVAAKDFPRGTPEDKAVRMLQLQDIISNLERLFSLGRVQVYVDRVKSKNIETYNKIFNQYGKPKRTRRSDHLPPLIQTIINLDDEYHREIVHISTMYNVDPNLAYGYLESLNGAGNNNVKKSRIVDDFRKRVGAYGKGTGFVDTEYESRKKQLEMERRKDEEEALEHKVRMAELRRRQMYNNEEEGYMSWQEKNKLERDKLNLQTQLDAYKLIMGSGRQAGGSQWGPAQETLRNTKASEEAEAFTFGQHLSEEDETASQAEAS